MNQQPSEFFEKIEKSELSEAIDISAVNDTFDIQVVSKGGKDILVPVNINDLNALNPNWQAIATLSEQYGVIGMHVFGLSETDTVCRNFAPLYGINEESATGTSSGALACYLFTKNIRRQKEYIFQQGANLGSPSEIVVKLSVNQQDEIIGVNVGGAGYVDDVKFLEVI
ncbi:PhzF family phenazine biosynthesis protein [Weissella sp. MSCH1]|uniref:PhzF family phenazine biosynthesis protein n=1 Tax=Weissella sp. MSCH1 TaxID=3383343 RepID=UPI003896AE5C